MHRTRATRQATRHQWVKVKQHVYICRACGTGRVNSQQSNGEWWITTWWLPDGTRSSALHVPPCEKGLKTAERLQRHASAIACAERG
jgi:hypothetical protein